MSQNLQFRHDPENRRTYALDMPSLDTLQEKIAYLIAGQSVSMDVRIGCARVHPLDRYCKATGRSVAIGEMKVEPLWLKSVIVGSDEIHMFFASRKYEIEITASIPIGTVRLVHIEGS